MDPRSKHLSREGRGVIFSVPGRGSSPRVIGRLVGRPASTICRELARGRQGGGSCCAAAARRAPDVRQTPTQVGRGPCNLPVCARPSRSSARVFRADRAETAADEPG